MHVLTAVQIKFLTRDVQGVVGEQRDWVVLFSSFTAWGKNVLGDICMNGLVFPKLG